MADYIRFGKKKLRKGYTTGTTATAAAAAATAILLGQEPPAEIKVTLPDGSTAVLPLHSSKVEGDTCCCTVIKDGGDDPDITDGLKIVVTVRLTDNPQIIVAGGKGVGRVTQKGLKVPVGEAAINPVPLGMLKANLSAILPKGKGAEVVISVPRGEEIAAKTFNPKLGIVNGISILGSTGIVNPMSEDALKESLALELNILHEKGYDDVIFAFGNYGLDFLRSQNIAEDKVIKISNYIGFMLDKALDIGVKRILLSGHIGKLVKVAGGIFNTHSRNADCRMEIITAYAGLAGADQATMQEIYQCKTTSAALEIVESKNLQSIYQRIVENVSNRCKSYVYEEIEIGAIMFGEGNVVLYMDEQAQRFLKEINGNGR